MADPVRCDNITLPAHRVLSSVRSSFSPRPSLAEILRAGLLLSVFRPVPRRRMVSGLRSPTGLSYRVDDLTLAAIRRLSTGFLRRTGDFAVSHALDHMVLTPDFEAEVKAFLRLSEQERQDITLAARDVLGLS